MTQGIVAGGFVAALFGVLIASVVHAPLWQQIGAGLVAAAVAFGTLRSGALLYDRTLSSRRSDDDERDPLQ